MGDKEELPWIYLEGEKNVEEEEEVSMYNPEFVERIELLHSFPELAQYMYPECKDSDRPVIMNDVEAFRYGFKFPEGGFRNITNSTLSKILKNFVDFGSLPDSVFVLGNVRFLAELFDLEEVREQVRAYLSSPYTGKDEDLVIALESLFSYPHITEAEKQLVRELLGFLKE